MGLVYFWFRNKNHFETVLKGFLPSLPIFVILSIVEPFLQHYFGALDLSSIDDVRGDIGNYLFILFIVWTFAAFGEELLFRGYYMQGFAKLFGGSNKSWILSAIFISLLFGISHAYQGPAGVIAVFIGSMYSSLIYYFSRNNLALAVFEHGFYDSIALTFIFLNKDGAFSDWVLCLFGLNL